VKLFKNVFLDGTSKQAVQTSKKNRLGTLVPGDKLRNSKKLNRAN